MGLTRSTTRYARVPLHQVAVVRPYGYSTTRMRSSLHAIVFY